jgi:ABC-type antimicrobial peptide transport system permease subunit
MNLVLLQTFVLFFDIAPNKPVLYGTTAAVAAIAFGLFLSAIAVTVFLVSRKALPFGLRTAIVAVLLTIATVSGVAIYAIAARIDAATLDRYEKEKYGRRRVINPNR